jgi:cell division protein FtsQ
MTAAIDPVAAALAGSFKTLFQATLQRVRDPYRLWLWLQLPLWLLVVALLWQPSQQWLAQPLSQIEIDGDLQQLNAVELEQQLWQHLSASQQRNQNFASQDLLEFKQLLEQQPWVNEVAIRRSWPNRLQLQIREQHPVARWGEQGLINEQGVIFTLAEPFAKQHQAEFLALPQLSGPQQRSLSLMAQYRDFNQLLRPLNLSLTGLAMEERGAWTLQLNNGIRLIVGRGQSIEKLQRFGQVYRSVLKRYADRIEQVDVRYTNGLAVTWREQPVKRKAGK